MVTIFYEKSIRDDLLGEVFKKSVNDSKKHIEQVSAFWSTIMLGTNEYQSDHFNDKHKGLSVDKNNPTNNGTVNLKNKANVSKPISSLHFERWLLLFSESANIIFKEDIANQFISKSKLIASKLFKPITE
jgi:hemoglobin